MTYFRIIEQGGEVHMQIGNKFLWRIWWRTYSQYARPFNFKTVDAAKLIIDKVRTNAVPTKITTY